MTRKNAREYAVQLVYNLGFSDQPPDQLVKEAVLPDTFERLASEHELFAQPPDEEQTAYINRIVTGVFEHQLELDAYIEKYAVGWQFGRIPLVSVAIMRVCMFEVLYMPEIPPRAAMNEAVEIAKKYEPKEMVSFLNGIVGSFYKYEVIQ